jgi:uncharacterized protein (DUF342 family)
MEPSNAQSLSLQFDRISGELTAIFTPAEGVQAPNLVILKQAITDGGYSKLHIEEAALNDFATKAAAAKEELTQKIGERRDGEFVLEVSGDLMAAYLTLVPPQGGRAKAVEVVNEIRAQGITHGILHEKLRGALGTGHCTKLLVAQGEDPVQGDKARFESLLDEKKEELAEIDDDAVVSYADLSHLLLIKVGDPLMRRIPTVPGTNGINIKGQPVLAKPVQEITFNKDCVGTEADQDDPDLLLAAIAGQPSLITNGVRINPIVEIEDLDLSTGNLEFSGTVKVKGDVKTGMRLHVSGDVFVHGTVEAAEIHAGGNVFIKGGIIGHAEAQPGVTASIAARIKSEGSVQALFAESALIEAGDSILIAGNARQCEMLAGNEIVVGKGNPKLGQIIGGRAQATMLIKATGLGSSSGNTTKIQVGLDPYLEEKLRAKEQEFQKKLDELDRTIKQIAYYKQNPEKGKNGEAEEAEHKRKILAQEVKDLVAEQAEMKEDLVAAESARIIATKSVHEGVEMRIARQVWQVLSELGGGSAQLQGGKIAFGKEGK